MTRWPGPSPGHCFTRRTPWRLDKAPPDARRQAPRDAAEGIGTSTAFPYSSIVARSVGICLSRNVEKLRWVTLPADAITPRR